MAKKVSWEKESALSLARAEAYALQTQKILDQLTKDTLELVMETGYDGSTFFSFEADPDIFKKFQTLQRRSANDIRHTVEHGIVKQWSVANALNDDFVRSILGDDKAAKDAFRRYFSTNNDARDSFIRRTRNGLNLSQRIWNIEGDFKRSFEAAITSAISDGTSAAQLSREIRSYLKEPDKLFRRVRTLSGDLVLSKPARKYHPEGGYRSSYKNAMRLAATEINMAYRTADQLRWDAMDFVVGYEVKRSNHPYPCPLCEALQGKYPKDFKFSGWHPWCRCHATPILKTQEEMDRDDELIMSGKEASPESVNKVETVPDGYKQWVWDNESKIRQAENNGTLPFFLKANPYAQYFPQYTRLGLPEIESLVNDETDSMTRFVGKNGEWLSERTELHNKIVADYIRGGSTQTGKVYMLGGATANGKSTLVDSGFLPHPKGILKIDPDAIKAMIPEYSRMLNSGNDLLREAAARFTHEESSYLSKTIQRELRSRKLDFVLDGVNDGSFEKLSGKLSEMRSAGMKIRADYVSLDADLSVKLAADRATKTGRYVDLDFVKGMNSEVSKLVPEIIKNRAVDELYLWDTNINGKPRLILEQINGKLKIYDRELYASFLAKYRR